MLLICCTPLKWAFNEKIIPVNPVVGLTKFLITNKKRGILTEDEAAAVFSIDWEDKRAYVGSLVAATTGASIEQRLSSSGVTSVLATWESSTLEDTFRFIDRVKSIANNNAANNVEIADIHLEGPYLNKAKKGMHQEEFLRPASVEEVRLILEKTGSFLKVISIAPETSENMAVIETLAAAGVSVSVAHTEADYDTALAVFSAGASRVTHTFNAMPALNQRYKGIITAAWQYGAFMELIADNHHVSPTIMKMFVSAADPGKIVLVSDNNECSGLHEGSSPYTAVN
jgi:N-acetylglucosamine-6-phosphate deacetylase